MARCGLLEGVRQESFRFGGERAPSKPGSVATYLLEGRSIKQWVRIENNLIPPRVGEEEARLVMI